MPVPSLRPTWRGSFPAAGSRSRTPAVRIWRARRSRADGTDVDPFTAQHLALAQGEAETASGRARVTVDLAESPLAWLARRKGRDGRALIEPAQFQAGERLRADFTRAQLMPRITANWASAVARDGHRGARASAMTETIVAARQRVRHALDQVGPEFTGLLLDVCCFLKGLEDVERERGWPPQLGQSRAAAWPRPARTSLRLPRRGARRRACAGANLAGRGCAICRERLNAAARLRSPGRRARPT